MNLLPRALVGVAPAAVVLVGTFWMSRHATRSEVRENAGTAARTEVMVQLSPDDEDRLHRVALKEQTVDNLMEGRMSLADAVDRFERLAGPSPFRTRTGETDRERVIRQVLSYARNAVATNPDRFAARLAELESEAAAFAGTTTR